MPHLTLNLLGPFQALLDNAPIVFRSDKERALLAYLALEADRPHRREALTGLLYPDQAQSHAQSNLRKTLFRLRAALGETDDAGILLVTPKTVQFNPAAPHTLDVQKFRAEMERVRTHKHRRMETCAVCAERCAAANALYRGEFLAGFNRSGSDAFEEWAVITREQLHQHALAALEQLVAFHLHRRDWERAITFARRLLELESWRETAHRALMTAFAAQNQRAAAFAQYDACKKILREQFDAEPERETRALHETIRNGTFTSPQQVSNLPSPLTPLIGRAREIETLTARLLDPAQRLHTIVGPGGIGKTRLALAAAERVRHDFRHGAFFVALADIHSDTRNVNDAIATAAADALNVTFSGSIAPTRQLQNYLRDKEALLVLDNLEQLVTSATWLVELLTAAPQLTILATAREPLSVSAEAVLRLGGLTLAEQEDIESVRASDSAQLFIERATRAGGEMELTNETLRVIHHICRRVQGMPLAIELAAAWRRTRTLDEIARELDAGLDVLTTTHRDAPERHRSLRAVWEGSWTQLDARLQSILAQASIFRGEFSQEAAKIIIKSQISDLDIFIDKSLVQKSINARYALHTLLRYFTSEKLQTIYSNAHHDKKYPNSVQSELEKRYSDYYLEFVATRGMALLQGDPQTPLAEIRQDLDNFRAGWTLALTHSRFVEMARALEGVTNFYYLTGLYREGLVLVEQTQAQLEQAPQGVEDFFRELQLARAEFLERLAQYDNASQILQPLLIETAPEMRLTLRAHLRAAWIGYWTGQLERGRAHLQKILSDAAIHVALQADALYVAGLIEQSAANLEGAREFYERALALYRAEQNRYGESSALVNLADICVDNAALDDAMRYGEQALDLSTRIGKRFDQAASNVILGSLYASLGDTERALPYYGESLRIFRELGNGTGESIALRDYAMLHLERGDARGALEYAQDAARVAHEIGSPYREGMARITLGDAWLVRRDLARAEASYTRAMELLRRGERGNRALDAWAGLVRIALARDDAATAFAHTNEILARFDAHTFYDSQDPGAVYLLCARVLEMQNDARARTVLERGHAELQERAAHIRDDALRQIFLEQVPSHRALRDAYARR